MATNTYVALDKVTVGTATPSITFTNINQTYTDLVLVVNTGMATADVSSLHIRVGNGSVDTGTNYSSTDLLGDGTSATSGRTSSASFIRILGRGTTIPNTLTNNSLVSIMNYANTTTYKTLLIRGNVPSKNIQATAGLWRSTSAINTITISDYESGINLLAGSTFSLYGIAAEVGGTSTKATGGVVTSDATYYYHTFLTSGNFVPNQSITADYLVIGGGGSGGGGGGAGAYRTSLGGSALSLTATSYAVLVGAGGASQGTLGNNIGANGNDTIFSTITSNGGGHAGEIGTAGATGSGVGNGNASGGGAGTNPANSAGAGGTYGNAGGLSHTSYPSPPAYGSGGGGGAGAAGGRGSTAKGGDGGAGLNTNSTWATVTGTGVSGYYAGGGAGYAEPGYAQLAVGGAGGGGNATTAPNGTANTGSGAGSIGSLNPVAYAGGNGGSGIVIVRYAK
jgi:hypothetical protein